MALMQMRYVVAQIVLHYEVYQTPKTSVPPKYFKFNPTQLFYPEMVLGLRKRAD